MPTAHEVGIVILMATICVVIVGILVALASKED